MTTGFHWLMLKGHPMNWLGNAALCLWDSSCVGPLEPCSINQWAGMVIAIFCCYFCAIGSLCEVATIYSTPIGEFTARLFFLTFLICVFLSHEDISSLVFILKDIILYFYAYVMRWQERVEMTKKWAELLDENGCLHGVIVVDGLN